MDLLISSENIVMQMIGEFPEDQDDLDMVQDHLLWLMDQEEDPDVLQQAVNDYMDIASLFFEVHRKEYPIEIPAMWVPINDGDRRARRLFERHYSADAKSRRKRNAKQFVGPGEKVVLMTPLCDALFAWRLAYFRNDGQIGAECSVFRNESNIKSSELILKAEQFAIARWPDITRFFTYVNPAMVQSSNPGYCFQKAGWRRLEGESKKGLICLAKTVLPPAALYPWQLEAVVRDAEPAQIQSCEEA